MGWEEKESLIVEMRELIADITEMQCVQPIEGWDEYTCNSCRFAIAGDCDIWIRRDDLLERSDPDPLPF